MRSIPNRLARYPFLMEAREILDSDDVGYQDMLEPEVVNRASERIEESLNGGGIGELNSSSRVELYSYPLARVLVSLVDQHTLTRRYAWSEANTAYDRFKKDVMEDGVEGGIGFEGLLQEFDLSLKGDPGDYWMPIGDYLGLASGKSDEKWKLVNRSVDDGYVSITRGEVLELAREGVRKRVSDGLPMNVPDDIKKEVEEELESIKELFSETALGVDIEVVEEQEFPPCMKTLLGEIREGEHLEHHSRFAITAFLTNIGMSTDEIVEMYEVNPGFGEEMTRYQTDHIRGETGPVEYNCPSCATMVTYGDCRNKDELCEEINHPLGYYRRRLKQREDDSDD